MNNSPLYQRLVLNQGVLAGGLMTAPSDEAIRRDVEMTKELRFNGARKHQKIEDPRYYYWADKLGLLVWGEMPSNYDFTPEGQRMLFVGAAGLCSAGLQSSVYRHLDTL